VAWQVRLAIVRHRVFDHIERATSAKAAQALSQVAASLEEKPSALRAER
jgi:hypothetical protein